MNARQGTLKSDLFGDDLKKLFPIMRIYALGGVPALVPGLYVSNLDSSMDFYVGIVGFRVEYERPEERFVALSLGTAHIMLEEAPSLRIATPEEFSSGQWRTANLEKPFGRGCNFEIRVPDLHAINARVGDRGYPRLLDLHEKTYRVGERSVQMRQLLLSDPDGYLVRLSEPAA